MKRQSVSLAVLFGCTLFSPVYAQSFEDILDSVTSIIEEAVSEGTDSSGDAVQSLQDYGQSLMTAGQQKVQKNKRHNPFLPPSDPLDDLGEEEGGGGRHNPLLPPKDPLDDPGGEDGGDGRHNPFLPPKDPLDDRGDDPWAEESNPPLEGLMDKMRKLYGEFDAKMEQELDKLFNKYIQDLKEVEKESAERKRSLGDCKQIELAAIRRDAQYRKDELAANYALDVEEFVILRKSGQLAQQGLSVKMPQTARKALMEQGKKMAIAKTELDIKRTQKELDFGKRWTENREKDIGGNYQCRVSQCEGDSDCVSAARRSAREASRDNEANYRFLKDAMDNQLVRQRESLREIESQPFSPD